MEGGVFASPLFFPSIAHYPASLTKFNLFSPSFIIYTPSYLLSVHLQLEVSTSKALAPVKTLLTSLQRQPVWPKLAVPLDN